MTQAWAGGSRGGVLGLGWGAGRSAFWTRGLSTWQDKGPLTVMQRTLEEQLGTRELSWNVSGVRVPEETENNSFLEIAVV